MGYIPPEMTEREDEYRLPVRKLYPELTKEEAADAEHFLTGYLETIEKILDEESPEDGAG